MTDKLIEAINSWENDYLNCTDDELSIIVNAARSTLTPPDTQGAFDVLMKWADTERKSYEYGGFRKCDCTTIDGALHYGRAQGLEMAADYIRKKTSLTRQPVAPDTQDVLQYITDPLFPIYMQHGDKEFALIPAEFVDAIKTALTRPSREVVANIEFVKFEDGFIFLRNGEGHVFKVSVPDNTLLDQAINAPDHIADVGNMVDLEILKREVCNVVGNHHTLATHEAIRTAIDHLAPRIVREGMVVVPEEPTEEMIEAFFNLPYDFDFTGSYKAMIAASKGD
jgi:hypothetical protein